MVTKGPYLPIIWAAGQVLSLVINTDLVDCGGVLQWLKKKRQSYSVWTHSHFKMKHLEDLGLGNSPHSLAPPTMEGYHRHRNDGPP